MPEWAAPTVAAEGRAGALKVVPLVEGVEGAVAVGVGWAVRMAVVTVVVTTAAEMEAGTAVKAVKAAEMAAAAWPTLLEGREWRRRGRQPSCLALPCALHPHQRDRWLRRHCH